jgi:hypothetical protein
MRIRMRHGFSSSGPMGSRHEGCEYEVSDAEGRDLIAAGAAVAVGVPKPEARVAAVEEAIERRQESAEQAVTRKGKGRDKGRA